MFTGRGWVFDRLGAFLAGPGRAFLLTGGPGTGKSAIAARLIEMSAGTVPAPGHAGLGPGFLFYAHLCRANDPDRIRPYRFVEALSSHLGSAFEPCREAILASERSGDTNVSVTVRAGRAEAGARVVGIQTLNVTVGEGRSPTDAFQDLVAKPLQQLEESGDHHPIVVLVDGLDEALAYAPEAESRTIPGLLGTILQAPDALPSTVRFLLTARPDKRVLRSLGKRSDLDLIADAPADLDDVGDYAKARFEDSPVLAMRAGDLAVKVAQASAGNFMYAYHVVKDLLDHPDRAEDVGALEFPEDLEGVYRGFLERELARDAAPWEDRYRPVLGALAVARGDGLTFDQIAGTVGLTRTQLAGSLRASAQYLAGPEPDGPYRIYHQSFREFLLEDPDWRIDTQGANQALAEYLLDEYGESWASCDEPYALAYTPTHLAEAIRDAPHRRVRESLIERLVGLLGDLAFLEAKAARLGIDAVLSDVALPEVAHHRGSQLAQLHRLLGREAHYLRDWDRIFEPARFLQQLYVRAVSFGWDVLAEKLRRRLDALGRSFLTFRWSTRSESPAVLRVLHSSVRMESVTITADGTRVISLYRDGVQIWDLATGILLRQVPIPSALAVSADGGWAISASGGTLVAWDLTTGRQIHTLPGPEEPITAAALTPDGSRALCAYRDGTLKVWDLTTGTQLHTLDIWGVRAVSADGRWGYSITDRDNRSGQGRFQVYDLRSSFKAFMPIGANRVKLGMDKV